MAAITNRQTSVEKPPRPGRDIPGCIKYILLLFLILLLVGEIAAGEFSREMGWLAWLILIVKLILIIGLVVLIWIQRNLECQITAPTGCTEEEPDPAAGILFVRVMGTASGTVFGHYTLEIAKGAIIYPAALVTYPAGGGAVRVVAGELGRINTTSLSDGAYTITLRVYPAGAGSPKSCSTSFDLLKATVYMNRIGSVQAISMVPVVNNPNPFDPLAELRMAPGFQLVAVGGVVTMKGAAYIYECAARKIKKYEIRYAKVSAPGTEPPQPSKGDPIPATWPGVNTAVLLEYTVPDQYQPWTRVGPMSTDLVDSWYKVKIGLTEYYKLSAGSWNSGLAGAGRYSLLLTAEDTTGITYHDIQHVWLDNKTIIGRIVKFQRRNPQTGFWEDIPTCLDLLMSFGTIRVVGLAWDPLIDEAWWPATAPNDNFDYYNLVFWKQFSPVVSPLTGNIISRVPALPGAPPVLTPTNADAGELAQWDLTQLNADAAVPTPVDPANKLHRRESCSYSLQLFVTDKSIINDGATTHYTYHEVPVKIINDL